MLRSPLLLTRTPGVNVPSMLRGYKRGRFVYHDGQAVRPQGQHKFRFRDGDLLPNLPSAEITRIQILNPSIPSPKMDRRSPKGMVIGYMQGLSGCSFATPLLFQP